MSRLMNKCVSLCTETRLCYVYLVKHVKVARWAYDIARNESREGNFSGMLVSELCCSTFPYNLGCLHPECSQPSSYGEGGTH